MRMSLGGDESHVRILARSVWGTAPAVARGLGRQPPGHGTSRVPRWSHPASLTPMASSWCQLSAQHLFFRPTLTSQCTILTDVYGYRMGRIETGMGGLLGSGCDLPKALLLSSHPSHCQLLPGELWQLPAKHRDPVSGQAVNECSVWDQSTRWMLFRFGSVHRKHSTADAAPGGSLACARQLGQPAKAH